MRLGPYTSLARSQFDQRIAAVYAVGLEFAAHHRACGDHAAFADYGAVQQNAVGTDPDIVPDHDAAFAWTEALGTDRCVTALVFVVDRSKRAVRRDSHTGSDADA